MSATTATSARRTASPACPTSIARTSTEAQTTALDEARYRVTQLSSALQDVDPEADDAPAAFGPLVSAMAAVAGAPLSRGKIGAVMLSPAASDYGFAATFYSVPLPAGELPEEIEDEQDDDDDEVEVGGRYGRAAADVEVPQADVEVEGSSHVFHETRTDVATRGLIRDLADDPERGADGAGGAAVQAAGPALVRRPARPRRCRSRRPATAAAPRRRSRRWTAR